MPFALERDVPSAVDTVDTKASSSTCDTRERPARKASNFGGRLGGPNSSAMCLSRS